ncbi:hypothetical protein O6H91_13G041800 [Diphasiastrum complanatum]|uniref:Uncharacterized protein n=1 Tax=Diphasiastrum complanatum TaxID=34168 RepID=A0ACC2BU91_DIPCM|nr:hypothetical protein O6H91_13G041800 [Diphasiastrum complanatum]
MVPRPFERQVRFRPDLPKDVCNFCSQRGHRYFNCVLYHRQCVGNLERGLPPPRLNNRFNDHNVMQNPPQNPGGMNGLEQQAAVQVITMEEPPLIDVQAAVTHHKEKGKAIIREGTVEDIGHLILILVRWQRAPGGVATVASDTRAKFLARVGGYGCGLDHGICA